MMNSKPLIFVTLIVSTIMCFQNVNGCNPTERYFPGGADGQAKAIVILKGVMDGQAIVGALQFVQNGIDSPIHISGNITGLPTGKMGKHGLHVHQHAITDLSDNVSRCKSSGGHFNPTKVTHGNISDLTRHVGDYGNVLADENGVIQVNFVDSVSQLYGPFGIIGRTMVLHKNEDDLGLGGDEGSKATGNAGDRIACGMIGIL